MHGSLLPPTSTRFTASCFWVGAFFTILIIYWLESAIIGFFNIIKIAFAPNLSVQTSKLQGPEKWGAMGLAVIIKLFIIPFFILHFGGFMFGHFIFISAIRDLTGESVLSNPFTMPQITPEIMFAFLLLFSNHLFSFVKNYIFGKEYKNVMSADLMTGPYLRIILMQVTLIFGAFFSLFLTGIFKNFGLPVSMSAVSSSAVISIFVLLKIFFDIKAHQNEHAKLRS